MRCLKTSFLQRLVVLALGPCLFMVSGCGDSKPASGPTGSVSGKVTLNGKPLPAGCSVAFTHQEKSIPARGTIGADGAYSIEEVQCLGSCGTAVCVQVNNEPFIENVQPDRLDDLLRTIG